MRLAACFIFLFYRQLFMKRSSCILLAIILMLASCDRVKKNTKSAINTTGEAVGKGASEFVNGVSEGIDQTFQSKIELSGQLPGSGLSVGKFRITHLSDTASYVLTAYLVFNKDMKQMVSVKVYDKNGNEYGRTASTIEGKAGEAKY